MLNKIVQGRLGNQMFQYATMRAFQEKYYPSEKINLNFSEVRKLGKKEDGFDNKLDIFTYNKTISKICDSYRVSKKEKIILKEMRKKNEKSSYRSN